MRFGALAAILIGLATRTLAGSGYDWDEPSHRCRGYGGGYSTDACPQGQKACCHEYGCDSENRRRHRRHTTPQFMEENYPQIDQRRGYTGCGVYCYDQDHCDAVDRLGVIIGIIVGCIVACCCFGCCCFFFCRYRSNGDSTGTDTGDVEVVDMTPAPPPPPAPQPNHYDVVPPSYTPEVGVETEDINIEKVDDVPAGAIANSESNGVGNPAVAPPPPPPAPPAASSAGGYMVYTDAATGHQYEHNATTGDTRWLSERPPT